MWCRLLLVYAMAIVLNGQSLGGPTHGKKVVCYCSNWAYYNRIEGHSRFQMSTVDPSLCTHMIYFSAYYDIDKNIIKTLDPWRDLLLNNGLGNFRGITSLKTSYPHLKVLIAVGDLNEGPVTFSKMAADPEKRKGFVRNVKRFMKHFEFDGLDLNWLYPTEKGGEPYDRENLVQLVKELSESFKSRGYILAVSFGVNPNAMEFEYDLPNLSPYIDLMNMRSWDYHNSAGGFFSPASPLRGMDEDDLLSVESSVNYMLANGAPPHKMMLGLAFEGRTYILRRPDIKYIGIGDTSTKYDGFKGPYSRLGGYYDYVEICLELSNSSSPWIRHWDENSQTPYLRDRERLISYENPRSLAAKIKLAVHKNLGGILAWTLDSDDYHGICTPESHNEEEAYADIAFRLNIINDHPALDEALKTLNIPDEGDTDIEGPAYVISNGKLMLRLPKMDKPVKFKLTRFVNEITALTIQEKRILDEIQRVKKLQLDKQ